MTFQVKLALRYLSGRKLRTTLTVLAIVFGVMIIVGFNGVLPAMRRAVQTDLSAAVGAADLTISSETRGAFDSAAADVVRDTPGVAVVAASLVRPLILPAEQALPTTDGGSASNFILRGIEPEQAAEIERITLADGRPLAADDQFSMLISSRLAEDTGLGVGDTVGLPAAAGLQEFEIVGVASGRPPLGSEELLVPLVAAQALLNLPGQINAIDANFEAGSDVEAYREEIVERLGDGFQVGGLETGSEFAAAMEAGNFIFNMFGVVALVLGGFIIFITFRTVVVERRRDIGMLRAIGASRRTILGLILAESLLLGVVGTAIGIIAGVLMAHVLLAGISPIAQDFLHAEVSGASFAPYVFVLAVVMGVGITLLAGLFPALAAMRVSPLDALRPSLAEVERRRAGRGAIAGAILIGLAMLTLISGNAGLAALGIVLFMVGLALLGPILVYPIARIFGGLLGLIFAREGQIAQGNLTRQPGRAAITASVIMIGLALLVSLGGMITSLKGGLDEWLALTMGSDYLFMPQSLVLGGGNVGAGPQLLEEVQALPGVSAATTLRQTTTRVDSTDLQLIGLDPETYPDIAGLIFSRGDQSNIKDLGAGRNMIVNGIFASQKGLQVGDTVSLLTPEGSESYRIVAIGSDLLNYKLATGYISHANMAADFNESADLLVMANRADGVDVAGLEAELQAIAAGFPAFTLYSLAEWQDEMDQAFAAFNGMYVLVIILSAPSLIALINTLAINVLERTREIGTLRAVGATRRQVRRMITAESLLLTAAGTLFGLLAGLWLSYVLVGVMNLVGLAVPFSFSYAGIVLAVVVGLGFGIIGALIPARQAARLDIVRALAYE
jgi:putative ABC transport system permease protein